MLKNALHLRSPDPYYDGTAGFVGRNLEALHRDMSRFELPTSAPEDVRRCHDSIRHAYIYSYFSYDLLTLAASQTFPCLELALRERIGGQFQGRVDKKGKPKPAMLGELLETAKAEGIISADIDGMNRVRKLYAHGSGDVVSPSIFLPTFELVTLAIRELFQPA